VPSHAALAASLICLALERQMRSTPHKLFPAQLFPQHRPGATEI
jgi:hypothetical protein